MALQPERAELSRARIIEAARQVLVEGGGDFELADLARRAGVSVGLPYHRFGLGKYQFLGWVYELDDYKSPSSELVAHLQAIIDEAFGRNVQKAPAAT